MIDLQQIIASGIIEEYCLGIANDTNTEYVERLRRQYPEIEAEIASMQHALTAYSLHSFKRDAPSELKNSILSTIVNLNRERHFDIHNLPLIDKYSNATVWNEHLSHIQPPETFEKHVHVLSKTPEKTLYLVWLKSYLEEEEHQKFDEHLLILEGECYFKTGNINTHYKAGDYIKVPTIEHSVIVTSKTRLKFIVQHLAKVA